MTDNFIFDLIDKFTNSEITSLSVNQGGDSISLQKKGNSEQDCKTNTFVSSQGKTSIQEQSVITNNVDSTYINNSENKEEVKNSTNKAENASSEKVNKLADDSITVKSPLIGTFYRSPSPDSPSYVEVGQKVKKGQPLCILEAMKMMNTLESEWDGVIEKILVETGDLVEYEQPIFIIRK